MGCGAHITISSLFFRGGTYSENWFTIILIYYICELEKSDIILTAGMENDGWASEKKYDSMNLWGKKMKILKYFRSKWVFHDFKMQITWLENASLHF